MVCGIGVGGSIHDFATCLIDDRRRVFAIEDERLSRVRYALFDPTPCEHSFRYVLDWANVPSTEIERVVGNDLLEPRRESVRVRNVSGPVVSHINKVKFPPLVLLNHHLTHAYSAFFTSPFDDAAILVMDGSGSSTYGNEKVAERETMTFSVGRLNAITTIGAVVGESSGSGFSPEYPPLFHNSLGHLYRVVTQVLGFGWMNAGKTMGLAPYGDDRFVETVMQYVRLLPCGQYSIRIAGADGLLPRLLELRQHGYGKDVQFAIDAALAQAVQIALEHVVCHALDYLWSVTKTPNVCLAGGVALNGLLNGTIVKRTKFKNVHVLFAPGDSGTAVGAAIWDYLDRQPLPRDRVRFDSGPFWGRPYDKDEVRIALNAANLTFTRPLRRHEEAAQLIARGKTVAWYEGGAEFGPRALGHRSILADPRNPAMTDHINKNIKGREWFRPVAPAVTESAAATYFATGCFSPYMQFVWPVREEYRSALPAITHIDGGARAQSVQRDGNESLHMILEAFEEITGFPVLINTSFNTRGAPMVETPEQAIESFVTSPLDVLVIGDYMVIKR